MKTLHTCPQDKTTAKVLVVSKAITASLDLASSKQPSTKHERNLEIAEKNLRQRHRQHQQVNFLFQERVQAFLVEPAVPFAGESSLGVPGPWDDEAVVAARFGRLAWRCGVGENIHAHGLCHACNCIAISVVSIR